MRRSSLILAPFLLLAACGDDDDDGMVSVDAARPDARVLDGGADAAPADAGLDAGADASADAQVFDAGADASPPDAAGPDAQTFDAAPPVDHDIRDLQSGTIAAGSKVRVAGAVVTARADTATSTSLFIQEPTGDAPFSGIFVFVGASPAFELPSVGDVVTVEGTVDEFVQMNQPGSRTNIDPVTSITVTGTAALPAPVVVPAADLLFGTETAEPWEGVLVRVEDVTVLSKDNFGEFTLVGGLKVDDRLFAYTQPLPGDTFEAIVGPVDHAFGTTRLLPRSAADLVGLVVAAPTLVSLTPPTLTLGEDEDGTLTVTLDRAAPVGGTSVSLGSDAPTVAAPATAAVIVASGSTTATFTVAALASGTANVTAALGDVELSSVVTVDSAPAEIASLSPTSLDLLAGGGTGLLTVQLTKPAPAGGFTVAITSGDAGVAVPGEVVIPEGASSAGFRLRADSMTAIGPVTITAGPAMADVSVVLAPTLPAVGDLILNEVSYDPIGTTGDASCNGMMDPEDDEFIEIVNGSNRPLDLTGVTYRDSGTTSYQLPMLVLGPGEVLVIFGNNFGSDITAPWCKDLTATTIGGARVLVVGTSSGLGLGNSAAGDSVRLFSSDAMDATLLATFTYAGGNLDMSLTRSPDVTGDFVEFLDAPGHATDRTFSPGTRLDGRPFAAASPAPVTPPSP